MGTDDVGPIGELERLVALFAGEEVRQRVMEGSDRVGELSDGELAAWLAAAIERLEAEVDESTRNQIMQHLGFQCAEMNRSQIEQALTKRQQFATLEEFLADEEKNPSRGTRLLREGEAIYQCYDPRGGFDVRCYCSLWRGLAAGQNASRTWCQCSRGFVMKLWEAYVGRPVMVELVGSCIAGDSECRFRIHLPSSPAA